MKSLQHALYHVMVILLSAAVALSLPVTVSFAARQFLALWAVVQNEKLFLVALDGSYEHRIHFDGNDFLALTVDGGRIAWAEDGDIYLFEAER